MPMDSPYSLPQCLMAVIQGQYQPFRDYANNHALQSLSLELEDPSNTQERDLIKKLCSGDNLKHVAYALQGTNIHTVSFRHNSFIIKNINGFYLFALALDDGPVKHLNCSHLQLTMDIVIQFISCFSYNPIIRSLDLSFNHLQIENEHAAKTLIETLKTTAITEISFAHNYALNFNERALLRFITESSSTNLSMLNFTCCRFDQNLVVKIIDALQHNSQITTLNLNGNTIHDPQALAQRIPSTHLISLSIMSCHLGTAEEIIIQSAIHSNVLRFAQDAPKPLKDIYNHCVSTMPSLYGISVTEAIRKHMISYEHRVKPVGNAFFLSPPGSGKSFMAEKIYYSYYYDFPHYTNKPCMAESNLLPQQVQYYFSHPSRINERTLPILLDFSFIEAHTAHELEKALIVLQHSLFNKIPDHYFSVSSRQAAFSSLSSSLSILGTFIDYLRKITSTPLAIIIDNPDRLFAMLDFNGKKKLSAEFEQLIHYCQADLKTTLFIFSTFHFLPSHFMTNFLVYEHWDERGGLGTVEALKVNPETKHFSRYDSYYIASHNNLYQNWSSFHQVPLSLAASYQKWIRIFSDHPMMNHIIWDTLLKNRTPSTAFEIEDWRKDDPFNVAEFSFIIADNRHLFFSFLYQLGFLTIIKTNTEKGTVCCVLAGNPYVECLQSFASPPVRIAIENIDKKPPTPLIYRSKMTPFTDKVPLSFSSESSPEDPSEKTSSPSKK